MQKYEGLVFFMGLPKDLRMKIPCAAVPAFIIAGFAFLRPELTNIQFQNFTMIATALILGAKFNLSEISRMWLREKSVAALSEFLSDAKFSTVEMQRLHLFNMRNKYGIEGGCFLVDDTMKHHTKFCKWIHGAQLLFDHALGTNLKATCIVFLYYSDGALIKFPICHRIFYRQESPMPWRRGKRIVHKTKNELALEMLEWAIEQGFPKCIVLADAWFGVDPFIKGLKRLGLSYIVEIKSNLNVRVRSKEPKLTAKGKLCKKQYDLVNVTKYFKTESEIRLCGFAADKEKEKKEKVLFHTKTASVRLNSIACKHRVVQSIDPGKNTAKYLLSDQLAWEATKIISTYANRWAIEEFFRNAKQLADMEGATVRSEQGVTTSLCLVSWIDSLLHLENWKRSIAGKLTKEPLSVPSMVRRAQYENLAALLEKVEKDKSFVERWLSVEKKNRNWKRKKSYELIDLSNRETKAAA
jgi:hypothetical protein